MELLLQHYIDTGTGKKKTEINMLTLNLDHSLRISLLGFVGNTATRNPQLETLLN